MAPSRSTRITILLVIDVVFFFIELISGYAVGSLALVADSFHMLNDVLSLIVALYAIKLSSNNATDQYSYGWHRAEILGALVNGVFLLALCCSIFMEAIERFVTPSDISNPAVIMIVGACGLLSNIVGLLLFHENSHGHSHGKPVDIAHEEVAPPAFEDERTRPRSDSSSSVYVHPAQTRAQIVQVAHDISAIHARSPSTYRRSRLLSVDKRTTSPHASRSDVAIDMDDPQLVESPHVISPPLEAEHTHEHTPAGNSAQTVLSQTADGRTEEEHGDSHGHGHSHGSGSMNMRALILHVLGDALGNVGVIITGLVILLAHGSWRFYFDPAISLIIAVIIFSSALPLVKSTSVILLQGVPSHVSLNDIRDAINDVEGVISVHELHVWQLSEVKVIASVHVKITRDCDYMYVTGAIRRLLHEHGVHSATIQPEYGPDDTQPLIDCLIPCPPNTTVACDDSNMCCPPGMTTPMAPQPQAPTQS